MPAGGKPPCQGFGGDLGSHHAAESSSRSRMLQKQVLMKHAADAPANAVRGRGIRLKMLSIDEITRIEDRYCQSGEQSLGEAFRELLHRWECGQRDRETALRLLFLSWYASAEPDWLTGLIDLPDAATVFKRLTEYLDEELESDDEYRFVAGYMATLFPGCCGDEAEWTQRGRKHLRRVISTAAIGDPRVFSGRGAYGHYFAHIVRQGWARTLPKQ